MGTLKRLAQLSRGEWWALGRAAVAIVFARAMLLSLPFRAVIERLRRPTERSRASDPKRLAWAVGAVGRRSVRRNRCLVEAVALTWLLRRDGHEASLKIGADRVGDRFQAHAWVESGGRILIGGRFSPRRYSAFPDFEDRAGPPSSDTGGT